MSKSFSYEDAVAPANKTETNGFSYEAAIGKPEEKGLLGHARDLGLSAVKSAIAVPELAIGLADIPTGGRVGKFLENEGGAVGFRPKQAKEFLSELHTDQYKEQQRQFQEAEGILDKTGVALQNPSLIANAVTESIAPMLAGGVGARGLMGVTQLGQMGAKGAVAAGAIGEGAAMAGSQAEAIRQETDDGLLTAAQSGSAVATGALGALFGYLGGRVAQRFGFGDVDTMIAQGAKPQAVAGEIARLPAKSIPRQVVEGAIAEGFLEELPQSISEQIIQNLALGKSWSEGVEDAAVMGTLAGMAMGGGASLYSGVTRPKPQDAGLPPPVAGDEAQAGAQPGAQSGAQGFAPPTEPPIIDVAALGRAGVHLSEPAPTINVRAPEPVTPSQQMGLDPAAGPMSAAAALAVDTGATATMQQAAQAVDPETGEILQAGTRIPEQKQPTDTPEQMRERLAFIEQQARVNGGWDRRVIEERDRLQAELAKVEPAADQSGVVTEMVLPAEPIDVSGRTDEQLRVLEKAGRDGWREAAVAEIARRAAQQPVAAPAVESELPAAAQQAQAAQQQPESATAASIKDVLAKQIPDMTDGELQQAIDHYGPSHKRTAKLLKEVQKRGQGAEAAAPAMPATEQQPSAPPAESPEGWDGMTSEQRTAILTRKGGWSTAKGGLNVIGKKIVRDNWTKINPATRATIERLMQGAQTPNVPTAEQVAPQAQEAGGQEGEKAKWIKATVDKSRLNGSSGIQLVVAPNGGVTFQGDPNTSKDGKALLANYEKALAAGATQQEIAAALKAQQAASLPQQVQPTQAPTTPEQSRPAPGQRSEPAKQDTKAGEVSADDRAIAAYNAPQAAELDLRAKSRDTEQEGDVGVVMGNGDVRFVSLAEADEAARGAIAQGTAATPFQINNATGIRIGDAERVIQAAQASVAETATTNADAKPEFTTLKDRDGNTVTVRTADLSSDRERMPMFTKAGKRKATRIHRDNLDPTGEKRAEGAKEIAGNPLFNVITTKDGGAFASEGAAERELRRLGLQDTYEVAPASEASSGRSGFVVRRIKRAEAAASIEQKPIGQPAKRKPAEIIDNGATNPGEYIVREAGSNLARFEIGQRGQPVKIKHFFESQQTRDFVLESIDAFMATRAGGVRIARPQPGEDGYTLELAREDLAAMRVQLKRQGEDGAPVDDRLRDRIKRQEGLVAEMEADGKNDELDAEMRSYEAKADAKQPAAPEAVTDDDLDAMFDDVLAEVMSEQPAAEAGTAATAEAPAVAAQTAEPQPQPPNQEAMTESLEDELRAQKKRVRRLSGGDPLKLKAAEARLRAMRQSIFDAEDKWVPAARNGDQDALTKLEEAGFADTADAIRAFAPAAQRTAGKAMKSAAKNAASALDDAINGLGKLFGGSGRFSSGLTFDEETYAKAKPLFISAVANIRAASRDLRDVMKAVVDMVVERFGAETAKNMKPYVTQFVKDVRDGKVQLEQEQQDDERATVRLDGTEALDEVATEEGGGAEVRGAVGDRAADGRETGVRAGSGVDAAGVPAARGRGSRAARADSAEAGARGRARAVGAGGNAQDVVGDDGRVEIAGQPVAAPNIPAQNFQITSDLDLGKGGEVQKFNDNLAAIRALKQIEVEHRRATPEEQAILARYVGWGGLANAFPDPTSGEFKDKWKSRGEELRELLTDAEYKAARRSTRNAHYTSETVVSAIWKGVERLGFKGGLVLESSMGTGNFVGLAPQNVPARFIGVEYDSLTARIAQALYPQATVLHSGFQKVPIADNSFALNIGNPPFGSESLRFQFKPELQGVSIHNQFFRAGMDALRPGGIQAMVVSRFLMDAQDTGSRAALAKQAKLIAAIRLPDTAFKENARTEVVTDILFFQKLTPGEQAEMAAAFEARNAKGDKWGRKTPEQEALAANVPAWVDTAMVPDPLGGEPMTVNAYFKNNPQNILGVLERSGSMQHGADITVRLDNPAELAGRLDAAIARLPENVQNLDSEVLAATESRFKSMSDALRIALANEEAGHVKIDVDGKLQRVIERETPEGGFEYAMQEITAESPWSDQLTMDASGRWYKMEVKTDESGKPIKLLNKDGKATTRNLYERTTYATEAEVPDSMRLGKTGFERLTGIVKLRDLLKRQLTLETADAAKAVMEGNRKALAKAYEAFVSEHGPINRPVSLRLAMTMPDGGLVAALEVGYQPERTKAQAAKTGQDPQPETAKPAPILRERVVPKYEPATRAETASDALAINLAESGRVNIERIASLLNVANEEAVTQLQAGDDPLVFQDPETQRWETADVYLSGMVKRKLTAAKAAGAEINVKALEKVQPEPWTAENVAVQLGSTWVPPEVYAQFLEHLTGGKAKVSFSELTNSFSTSVEGAKSSAAQWGTEDVSAEYIVGRLLNSQAPVVRRTDSDGNTYIDKEATSLAGLKAREVSAEFGDWIFKDGDRRNLLVELFNEHFNTRVVRQYNGQHLKLPGKVPDSIIKMRRHQMNAIWRGIYERFTLVDHAVGAGKTFTAIARAMERRRMGLSRKPMIVVPNHLVEQWQADIYRLYPGAKVLAAGKKDFEAKRRRRLFGKIATGDWDIVIVPHSSFFFIGISPETESRYLDQEMAQAQAAIEEAWEQAKEDGNDSGRRKPFGVKEAERLAEKIQARMDKLSSGARDRLLTFEQLGVDDLTVDEAHEFKNLYYSSRLTGVRGMGDKTGSRKANDLYNKVRVLRENPNATVTFLTGTPISNSAVEMFTMLRYLAGDALEEMGMSHFDAFRAQFVEYSAAFEPTEAGGLKEVTRLGRTWSNMRSLMDLYYSVTDAVSLDDIKSWYAEDNGGKPFPVPKVKGGKDRELVAIAPTAAQEVELQNVMNGFEGLEGIDDPYERNAERLRLMDRARKLSLDIRAVNPLSDSKEEGGKLGAVSQNIKRIYDQWNDDRGTQLVFLDRSVPKSKGDDKVLKEYDAIVAKRDAALAAGDNEGFQDALEALERYDANEMAELRAAQDAGWNAYQQIKDNLVAMGIPANEIRFVQEANNDEQKAALFAAVNSGKVRVLIGSTPRMGAGTNVQERAVALHHVDVTWKPSDIEQREGRVIRQGNMLLDKYGPDFEVEIIAYATERTVDAKMWDLNATKLRTINGIRKYDGAFTMEFEDEEAVGMAEMAALASGNPLLLERVKLESEINNLELLERSFRRKMWTVEDQLDRARKAIQDNPRMIEQAKQRTALIRERLSTIGQHHEARTVTVEGQQYSTPADAMRAAEEAIKFQQDGNDKVRYAITIDGKRITTKDGIADTISAALGDVQPFEATIGGSQVYRRTEAARKLAEALNGLQANQGTMTEIGEAFGFKLVASTYARAARGTTFKYAELALMHNGREIVSREVREIQAINDFVPANLRPTLESIQGALDHFAGGNSERRFADELERARRDLPSLEDRAKETFPKAEELSAKRKRLTEVVTQLSSGVQSTGPKAEDVGVGAQQQANPLRNADGTFARQESADSSLAFSSPHDRAALRTGITEQGLVRAMRLQFGGLAEITGKMLERGRAGKRGGVIVIGSADPREVARIVAERTGRNPDATMRKFSKARRINGFYDPKSGLTFLVGPNLNPVTATAVLLHETMHGQQRQKLDARALEMVRNRHSLKDEDLRAFLDRVMLRMIAAGEIGNAAEASAYLVEQAVTEGRSAGYAFADNAFMQWVDKTIGKRVGDFLRSFAGMIRTWMLRNGLGAKTVTVDDFVGYAMAGLYRAAAGEVRGRSATVSASKEQGEQFRETERAYGGRNTYERAKAAGRTKLNYRQWVQVRTPAFKAWFGNWEGLRAQQQLDEMYPVEVRVPEEWRGLNAKDLRSKVQDALNALVESGEPLHHREIGDVDVARRGVKKMLSSSADPAKLMLLGDVRRAFESSVFASSAVAGEGKQNVMAYEKLLANISVDGVPLVAVFSVERHRDGRQFYNAVTLEDGKEKTPAASPRDTPSKAGERATSANTGVDSFVRRPLERVNPDSVSKVVDPETGEPLVVYHGTSADKDFTKFKVGARGAWFTSSQEVASDYAEENDSQGAPYNPDTRRHDPINTSSRVLPVFLKIENPYRLKGHDFMKVNIGNYAKGQRDLFKSIQGHDGVLWNDGINKEWVVLGGAGQIKSATGNNGDFDADNDDLNFSRSGLEDAQQAARNIGAGLKAITVQDVKKAGKHKLTDWLKLGLQFLGRRQLVDVYGDMLPLAEYDRLATQMEADKNDVGAAADELARRWGKLPDEGKLADLMHDATLAQIDADSAVEYVPGDDLAKSRVLKAQFGQLSTEAQKVYREARDHYRKHHAEVRQAIIDRIMRSELREERRAELLQRMDADFFKAIKGVYFPLSRFGQYVVVTKDDAGNVASVSRAETMAETEAMRAEMVKAFPAKDGYQVGRVILSKEFVAGRDMVGRGFMTELYEALDEQGLDPSVQAELEDTLGQLYLSSLPDLSWAKHGIHRKGTPGFSNDARRAFAQNTFHGARYLAKLKYGDQMQAELDRMQKHVDELATIEGFDQPAAQRVVDEMNKRHEATMNPKGNPLSTALTSFGFVYYLGISPAAAMVNLSQTPLVAYPVLGAKWGFRKAGAALMTASKETMEGKNDLRSRLKNPDELAAYDEAVRTGVIDVTMAHDLAGIAQGEDAKVMWKIRPAMRLASFLFHHAERFNRQATFIAAYRLARDAGVKHDAAYSQAVKATYDGHFDYSTGNRPRVMQGNVARVVLLFKQYAQNMIYTIGRNAYQSVKGESPEVRREARKVFGALMAMHAAAAGVLGLPMVGTLLVVASALGGSDDEPWNAEVAMRNMLADTFGAKPAEVIARGFSRMTPWDISGRVGLDKLLLPDVNESLEGQRWAESFATAMLGPVIGMGVNAAKGAQKMADGDYGRGLEDMLPIFARNQIKAYRQYSQGEVDRTGVVIKDEVSLAGVLGQASGFSPSEIRLAFEGRSAVMSADRKLAERRQDLMTQFARAAMDQDQEGMTEARAVIAEFNRVNPGRRITPPQMWQSVRNRQRRIREAEDGVYLPRTRRDVVDEGRFAVGA